VLDQYINSEKHPEKIPLERYINAISTGLQKRVGMPRWLPRFIRTYMMRADLNDYWTAINAIREIALQALQKKIDSKESSREKDRKEMDLIDFLFSSMVKKEPLSLKEIADETLGFFIAGHETTTNLIAYAVKVLCDKPELLARLQNEIDPVLDGHIDDTNYSILSSSLAKLPILEAFIKECLRHMPVIPMIGRQVMTGNAVLRGYHLPEGSIVFNQLYASQHSSASFENPDAFDIDRWLIEDEEKLSKMRSFVNTFGDGNHACVGQQFALLEIRVILMLFIKKFRCRHVVGRVELELIHTMTLGYKKGLPIIIEQR